MDEDTQREVQRENEAELGKTRHELLGMFLLHDPVINQDILSSNHATRYRAKERQAFECFVNAQIEALPLEMLNRETVQAIIKMAQERWTS